MNNEKKTWQHGIELMFEYCDEYKDLCDTDRRGFITSLKTFYEDRKFLSPKQIRALSGLYKNLKEKAVKQRFDDMADRVLDETHVFDDLSLNEKLAVLDSLRALFVLFG